MTSTDSALLSALLALALAAPAGAQQEAPPSDATPHRAVALAEALAPSLVRVEFRFRSDNGELPTSTSGRYSNYVTGMIRSAIEEERPLWGDGYLVAPDRVVTADFMVAERFVESIRVHFGDAVTAAQPVAYATRQPAVILGLAEALPGTKPLQFATNPTGGEEPPAWVAAYYRQPAGWATNVFPLPAAVRVTELGEQVIDLRADCLLLSAAGDPLGASFSGALHLERPWRGGPLQWEQVSAEQLAAAHARVERQGAAGLLRARLTFRSPRSAGNSMQMMMMGRDPDDALTEWNGLAVAVSARRALILAPLKPSDTARLERVLLFPSEGEQPIEASFAGSLRDYGALLVDTPAPLAVVPELAAGDVRALRDRLLLYREVLIQGERRVAHPGRTWFSEVREGRGGVLLPEVASASGERERDYSTSWVGKEGLFPFTLGGALVSVPMATREKVTTRERWSRPEAVPVPAAVLRDLLADLEAHVDPSNVPVAEGEENRLAWLGVELQPLEPELARANGVAHLTQGGTRGALVVYVYPDSPAAEAGLELGDVLLRLDVEGQPKPLEVELGQDPSGFMSMFPWDRLDEVPEQFFEQIPAPWPAAETTFTRALTDLGFGTAFTAQVARGGDVLRMPMQVVQSPPHFQSAKRHESQALGLTATNLTYEVRRYLQRGADEPGVVIAKLEMGGKASIAGIKPYELITHVNDEPVNDVADLERLLAPGGTLRLSIKRMHRGRIVKVTVPPTKAESGEASDSGD